VPLEVLGISPRHNKNIETIIRIKSRGWLQKDILFWGQFNISKERAIRYNVYPITHYWVNNHCFTIKPGELAYAFLEQGKFQIYQPYAPKRNKWFSNTGSMIYGYEQLPDFGDLLIITSSKKDIMTLDSLGYNACSSNNEGSRFPEDVYEDLNNRFNKVLLFYNNDNQGLISANTISSELGIDYVFIPREIEWKDPSDLVKNMKDESVEIIKSIINGKQV